MTRLAVAGLAVLAGCWWSAAAQPVLREAAAASAGAALPTPNRPLNFAADDISVTGDGTTLVGTGHVAIAYGSLRVTSDALRIYRPSGTATFTGHVVASDGRGRASAESATLLVANETQVIQAELRGHASVETRSYAVLADRILTDRQRDRFTAAGHVTVFSPPDLIVTGTRVTYDERTQHAVARGEGAVPASIQNRDGRLRGTSIDVSRAAGVARVRGPVEAEIYDARLTGADATIDLNRATAVFTGNVTVSRQRGTLRADRLTVYYRSKQFVAEGTTHMSLTDLEDSP